MLRNSLQYRLTFYFLYVSEYEYNIFSVDYLVNVYKSFFNGKNSYRIREKLDIK